MKGTFMSLDSLQNSDNKRFYLAHYWECISKGNFLHFYQVCGEILAIKGKRCLRRYCLFNMF